MLTSLFSKSFVLLSLSALFFFCSFHILSPLMPQHLMHRGFNSTEVGTLMGLFMVASLLIRPWAGRWSDVWNIKWVILLGIAGFLLCPLLYWYMPSANGFYGVRLLHGLGFALFYTASASYLVRIVPADHKAEGIGYYSNAIKLAMAFAPALGVYLAAEHLNIIAFWLAFGFGILTLLCIICLPSLPKVVQTEDQGPPKLIHIPSLFPGMIMATNSIVFGALMPYLPFMAAEKEVTAVAPWFYTIYAVCLIGSRWFTGRLSDQYGRSVIIIPGMALVVLALMTLATVNQPLLFLAAGGFYGLAAGLVQPSLMAMAADRAEDNAKGASMATFTMMIDLGIGSGTFGMALLGEQFGYSPSLWVIASITFLGLLGFLVGEALGKHRNKAATQGIDPPVMIEAMCRTLE